MLLRRSENMKRRRIKEEEARMGDEEYGRIRIRRERATKRHQRLPNLDGLEDQSTDPTPLGIYQDGEGEGAAGGGLWAEAEGEGGGGVIRMA